MTLYGNLGSLIVKDGDRTEGLDSALRERTEVFFFHQADRRCVCIAVFCLPVRHPHTCLALLVRHESRSGRLRCHRPQRRRRTIQVALHDVAGMGALLARVLVVLSLV